MKENRKERIEELAMRLLTGHDQNSIPDTSEVQELTDEEVGFDEQPFR